MSQETMTPETALGNLITIYKQSRLTPEEHDIMKVSIQTLIDLINRDKEMKATQEAKTSKKG
jgi:hypothetical protein